MQKNQYPKPSDRLWKTVSLWSWLFIISVGLCIAAFAYRLSLLAQLPGNLPMGEYDLIADYLPDAEMEVWSTFAAVVFYLVSYVVCVFLVLKWYLRSVRNARALFNGVETTPGWVVWSFIVPIISWFKPYSMTSELWRSSHSPEGWRGKSDPALLRWWWAAVVVGGLVFVASSIMSRHATTIAHVAISDGTAIAGYGLQIAAGLMFLRIGGAISRRQTRLIADGHVRPPTRSGEFA